ncbi:Mov34/MPN/PAD-1 family protein [Kordiimonas marina]|uniref:Mov34/MPN/PAD-1 family protein n=1 Tax=Kordiimonas marina TaxID=2872312 RepID=UPI001FF4E3E1|nr:M67 family metallopeptidase [Kordiimonas marina]
MLRLSGAHLSALEAEAKRAAPHEACALLVGVRTDDAVTVSDIHISPNVTAGNPARMFEVDPGLHLRLQRQARDGGLAVVGVWHSHPGGAARPSAEDRARSEMAGWCWLITGMSGNVMETQAFLAKEDDAHQLEPVPLVLV